VTQPSRGAFQWRWGVPAILLAFEYLVLSWLVDFPDAGPAANLVRALRLVVPVALGSAAGACLLSRRDLPLPAAGADEALPPWRPWPAVALQLVAFAFTAALAWWLMGAGAPRMTFGALAAWVGCAGVTALLAVASAAPLAWLGRRMAGRWRDPLLALAIGVLAWRAAAAAEGLWGALSSATLSAVASVVHAVGAEVTTDLAQKVIAVRDFEVAVAPECSGADGIGLVVIFQAVWLALARARIRFPAALLLLPAGALAAFGANVLRISALLLVGASGREALAMGGLHSKLGWLLFVLIALGSIALTERLPALRRPERRAQEPAAHLPADPAWIAPLLAALAAALATGLWSDGPLDRLYAVRLAAGLLALLLVRRSLPAPALSASWPPLAIGAAVAVLWIAWPGGDPRPLGSAVAALTAPERWTWLALRVAGGCVLIPAVEELAFRGFVLGWMTPQPVKDGGPPGWPWPAVLVSSAAFGATHADWLLGTLAGLAFAVARLRRGRLGDAIVAHATANAGIALAALLRGRWDLWS
jgi:exosortase E/protease (VPEID-CTERM system)